MVDQSVVTSNVQVMIVDDDEITRIGLKHALEKMQLFTMIHEESSANALLSQLAQEPVDLVLLDIGMPGIGGIEATRLIKQHFPHIKVLIFTCHDSEEKVSAALSAGADAYCVKNISVERLRLAIDCVLQGALWLDPLIARKALGVLGQSDNPAVPEQPAPSLSHRASKRLDLTEREFDVLRLITQGKSNKEIGVLLEISPYTVKTHIRNLTQKLGVEDRTQAAVKALTESLL
jgi:two-component system NarL family response regulator